MLFQNKFVYIIVISLLLVLIFPLNLYANSAESAIVMEVKTGRILYSKNIHLKRPMASTTKIMTALVALEEGNLEDVVKINPKAVGVEGSSIYLMHNEEITLEDLLYGLMLRSGNDAATAIAYHIAGSIEEFANLMNKKAKSIGANNTNFTNPHGLHDDMHYTTAYDLALITREALLNDKFKEIVSTKKWVSNRKGGYKVFYNKNKTLQQFPGGDGVKTGYTRASGRCLVTSATRNEMQVIAVVLNDYNWFQDCYNLMNNAFEKYNPYKAIEKNRPIFSVDVDKGKKDKINLASAEDIILPLTKEEEEKINIVYETETIYSAPITKGTILGKAKVYLDDKLMATTNLIAIDSVKEKKMLDYILDFFK